MFKQAIVVVMIGVLSLPFVAQASAKVVSHTTTTYYYGQPKTVVVHRPPVGAFVVGGLLGYHAGKHYKHKHHHHHYKHKHKHKHHHKPPHHGHR